MKKILLPVILITAAITGMPLRLIRFTFSLFLILLGVTYFMVATAEGVEIHFPSSEDPKVTFTLTGLKGYNSADARNAINKGMFGDYLKGLTLAKIGGKRHYGVGDSNVDANEAVLLTVTEVNIGEDEAVLFTGAATQGYGDEDSSDFICYDVSDNDVVHSEFDRKGKRNRWFRSAQFLEKGDIIILAAGASGKPQWRFMKAYAKVTKKKTQGGKWRVIPEDPRFPTDDVIVAYCDVTDARYELPANTEKQDCTAAIQAALDDAIAAGGGTVFLPEGKYRVEGTLNFYPNVFLRGRWREITAENELAGSLIMVHSKTDQPTIKLKGAGCGLRDLSFWRPDQKVTKDTASEHPFIITSEASPVTLENINLINPYNGIDLSRSGTCCLRGLYGSPLNVGLTADRSFAVSRYDSIHFSPDYWTWSGLPGSPGKDGAHRSYMKNHGTAVNIKEMDGFYFGFSKISGFKKGLHFEKGASGDDASGEISYVSVTDCYDALYVDDSKGFLIVGSAFEGSNYGIWGKDNTKYELLSCTVKGGNKAISIKNGAAKLVNCKVSGEKNITGRRTSFSEHTYAEKMPVYNNKYNRVRKPTKTTLFNVKDYGAKGNRFSDDTKAFQAAIAAAKKNLGGIVLVPDGEYRITDNLDLGKGIELRGNAGGRLITNGKPGQELGSLIFIEVAEGDEDDTAFVTMGDGSGLRGIGFFYPRQDFKNFKQYPFMIRANGKNNYIIDCSGANPYLGAELNGDDHLVEYSFLGGMRKTYQANNCSGGRIQNVHIKPDFWRSVWLPGCPKSPDLEQFKWEVNKIYETITLKNCDNYTLQSIFNHSSGTFATIDNSSGQSLMIGGEQQVHGYAFKNGAKSFDLIASKCNINVIGDRKGTSGIKLLPSFKGQVRLLACETMGTSDETWHVDGGHLFTQLSFITGPCARAAANIFCGPKGKITMQSSGARSHFAAFENKGRVSMKDCLFSFGFLNSAADAYRTDNKFETIFALADLNQKDPKMYGLELDMKNINKEEAMSIVGGKNPKDGRRLVSVRSTDGSYRLKVTDPDFKAGLKKDLSIVMEFYLDTDCTLKTHYRTKSGMKAGEPKKFLNAKTTKWFRHTVKINDAHFGSEEDIRIDFDGKPPLLAMVAIVSSEQ